MKIRVLGAYGAEGLAQRPSAFLVNDRLLIDGGTVGGGLTNSESLAIDTRSTPIRTSITFPAPPA